MTLAAYCTQNEDKKAKTQHDILVFLWKSKFRPWDYPNPTFSPTPTSTIVFRLVLKMNIDVKVFIWS
jgi:hypothetical protein